MYISKKFLLLIIFSIALAVLNAAYLKDQPYVLTQPNGEILKCLATGDEFHNWLHDENNFTIIQNADTGFYVYAELAGDKLVATNYIAGQIDPATVALIPGVNAKPADFDRKVEEFNQILADRRTRASTIGDLNNLVVFIRFADQTEFTETLFQYNNMFNAADQSSLYQYYDEVSDEQLAITSHFYPEPNGNLIVSYQSPNPRNYYEVYNAVTNPNGYQQGEQAQREHELLQAAIQFVETQIPATLDLDNDDDGRVDNVCFIVKGGTGAWADLLWPHMWVLFSLDVFIHGSQVWTYNFQLSQSLNSSGVGVLCHEMFHSLGAPDLYHYEGNGISPAGSWDLMCSNTNPPQHMMTWMKHKYGLWFNDVPEINSTGTYSLEPVVNSTYSCFKIPSPNSANEFFMVEYRLRTGLFEPSIPGDGLLIYRVDLNENGNASGPPDEVYLFRPDGTTTSNGNVNQANFSADVGRTMFNDNTNPACFLQWGDPGGIFISDIGFIGDTIEFTLNTGLVAMFETNVQSGPASLGVQFTNTSYPATGIDYVEWDFNGDGLIDSVEDDPYYLFEEIGTYDITLFIHQGTETAQITMEDYITVTDASSISGNISGIWKQDYSPYTITGDVVLNSDDEVLIEPGTEVFIENESTILVYGNLSAEGTEELPISFDSNSSWKGIKFNGAQDINTIDGCIISGATHSAVSIENNSQVNIYNCKIINNSGTSLGAAIDISSSNTVCIMGNIISNNSNSTLTGGIGCTDSSPLIVNNFIVNNDGGFAGAFSLKSDSNPFIVNNTIANNDAPDGAFFIFNSSAYIINNIIIHEGEMFNMINSSVEVEYTCLSGGYEGTGNIDSDPMFISPTAGNGSAYAGLAANWNLQTSSPCIDAGNPNSIYNDLDGTRNDMGATGGPDGWNPPTGTDDYNITPMTKNTLSVYPNPFNPTTTISFSLNNENIENFEIGIYNLKGQKVKNLPVILSGVEGSDTNEHTVTWDGTDNNGHSISSGVYFVRLKSGSVNLNKKVLLLK